MNGFETSLSFVRTYESTVFGCFRRRCGLFGDDDDNESVFTACDSDGVNGVLLSVFVFGRLLGVFGVFGCVGCVLIACYP